MTFSVVIPTCNGSKYVAQAIESVLRQTRLADEIIVSDDGSKDDTLAVCKEYGDSLTVYANENGPSGFVNGWNRAIDFASGDFIAILHQDDLLAPTFLEEMEKAVDSHPGIGHFFAPCNYINGKGEIIYSPDYCDNTMKQYTGRQYVKAYYTFGNPNMHRCPGVVTRRDVLKQCRYRPEAGHIADDDFFFRVGQFTDVVGVMKPLAYYRVHEESTTGLLDDQEITLRLLEDYDFQVRHAFENKLLDGADLAFFRYWKYRHFRRAIAYAIKHCSIRCLVRSLRYC